MVKEATPASALVGLAERSFEIPDHLLFTIYHSLFTLRVKLDPLITLPHVYLWPANRELTGKGRIRFQEFLNRSTITGCHSPSATLAHQVLLDNYLAFGRKRITDSPVKLRIRDSDITGDA